MPNWCLNRVTVSNRNVRIINGIIRAWYSGDLLEEFVHCLENDAVANEAPNATANRSDLSFHFSSRVLATLGRPALGKKLELLCRGQPPRNCFTYEGTAYLRNLLVTSVGSV